MTKNYLPKKVRLSFKCFLIGLTFSSWVTDDKLFSVTNVNLYFRKISNNYVMSLSELLINN